MFDRQFGPLPQKPPPVIVADLRGSGGPNQPGVTLVWLLRSFCELNPPVCAAGPCAAETPDVSEKQEASRHAWTSSSLSPADSSSEDSLQSGQRGTDSNRIAVLFKLGRLQPGNVSLPWQPASDSKATGAAGLLCRVGDSVVEGRCAVSLAGRVQAPACSGRLHHHGVGHGGGLTLRHCNRGRGAAGDVAAAWRSHDSHTALMSADRLTVTHALTQPGLCSCYRSPF